MKKLFLSVIPLLVALLLTAQPGSLDSMIKVVTHAKEDTAKAGLLINIERKYFTIDIDSSLYYATLCKDLLEKINAPQYKHRCYHDLVKIYHAKHDYKKALEYCLRSVRVAEKNQNRFEEATSYRAIFNIYHNLQMNDSAIKYAIHSIKLTTEIGDTTNISTNYGNLCWLYMDLNHYDKAIDFGMKGIKAGEKYIDTVGLLISINNLALCYHHTNRNAAAIVLFKRQIEIAKAFNRVRSIRNALINLATAYYQTGDRAGLNESVTLLNEYNKEGTIDGRIRSYQYIINAYNFIYQEKFVLAEKQLLEGMQFAQQDSLIDPLLVIYTTLASVKNAQHDFVVGSMYDQKWDSLSQTIKERELSEYALDLEAKYEIEKKSNRIVLQEAQLAKKSIINYLLLAAGVSVLVISLLARRTYVQKQKLQQQRINELETREQLTATEAVLKGEEQERTRLAKDLHDGLGGMLSGIKYSFNTMKGNLVMTHENAQAFERSMDMLDSSIKEMRRVAHNMMPEALVKFGLDTALKDCCNDINKSGALQVSYQSIGFENDSIEQTTAIAIYRIVQELINNTMKHAAAKIAVVQLTKTGRHVSITVEDDGKGFDTAILNRSTGMGWNNIHHRVEFLKGNLDVKSEKEKGTSVYIELDT